MKQVDGDFPQKDCRHKAAPAINFPSSRRHQLDIDLLEKFQLSGSSFQTQTLMRVLHGLPHKKVLFQLINLFIRLNLTRRDAHETISQYPEGSIQSSQWKVSTVSYSPDLSRFHEILAPAFGQGGSSVKGALPWCLSSTIIHLPMQVLGRSPGEGNDNLLQYSCLENPLGRGAYSPRRGKQLDVTQWLNTHI